MAHAYELEFSRTSDPGTARVTFHANPTAEGWGQLEEHVDDLLGKNVLDWTFDIQGMRFCDSHGLGMWLRLNTRIRRAEGRALYILRDPSRVLDLFRMTKLDQVLAIEERGARLDPA